MNPDTIASNLVKLRGQHVTLYLIRDSRFGTEKTKTKLYEGVLTFESGDDVGIGADSVYFNSIIDVDVKSREICMGISGEVQ